MTTPRALRPLAGLLLSLAAASCATAPPAPSQAPCTACAQHAHEGAPCADCPGHGGMHHAMASGEAPQTPATAVLPPALSEFREVLRPLWHAEPGPQRDADTCAQGATLRQRSDAVVAAPVPEAARGDQGGWSDGASALQRSSAALAAACESAPRQGVADQLAAVHVAFHALLDRVGVRAPPGR